MEPIQSPTRTLEGVRLFALSLAALFLELMVIRWVPSEIRLVAYYANLMLISSFLGLGVGAMLASRNLRLFRWFSLFLLLDVLLLLALAQTAAVPVSAGEWKFDESQQRFASFITLVSIFVANAMLFVPLGEQIGIQFGKLITLRGYTWDLLGSLCGTVFFGAFSLLHFSPVIGMALVVVIVLLLSERRVRAWSMLPFAATLCAIWIASPRDAYWSPYYFISLRETIAENAPGTNVFSITDRRMTPPPAGLRQMTDPPIYSLRVNKDIYQLHGSINPNRYTDPWKRQLMQGYYRQYGLPYQVLPPVQRVLVLGAGGGADVEAALLNGAQRVDAVEIDPLIPRIGDQINSAAPYQDPRVKLHIGDARAFLQNSTETFDLVAFGFLDSQGLFSYGSNLRIDGCTYTVESFRTAFERVSEQGAMTVSFFVGQPWMAWKLCQMVEQAVGRQPLIYFSARKLIIVVPRTPLPSVPAQVGEWQQVAFAKAEVDLATDDWPYLYLQRRSVPHDYAAIIAALAILSIAAVITIRPARFGASDGHFLLMGWGFLLLQTKSIGDCSLYFGTTWLVTTLVIAGVLIMVLAANIVAERFLRRFTFWLYPPLMAGLILTLLVPRTLILSEPLAIRLLWTLLVVPLPVFFAGLIFSTTFRASPNPAASLGANLIGATLGGFCEYLSMWTGNAALSYIIIAAYLGSMLLLAIGRKSNAPGLTAAVPG